MMQRAERRVSSFLCKPVSLQKRLLTIGNPSDLRIGTAAIEKLKSLNAGKEVKSSLRVQIDAGGCHGYQYKMDLTTVVDKEDIIFKEDTDATFVTDSLTLEMIKGGKLDWVEELIESSFQIVENPNAESSCGCKVSFNIKS